jgi:hypothetical protein
MDALNWDESMSNAARALAEFGRVCRSEARIAGVEIDMARKGEQRHEGA